MKMMTMVTISRMTPTLVADPSPSSSHSYGEILAKQKRVIAKARYAVVV